jgi:hypothetical protein
VNGIQKDAIDSGRDSFMHISYETTAFGFLANGKNNLPVGKMMMQ